MSIDPKQAADRLLAAVGEGLEKAGQHVLEESQQHVPVDTGDLKRSGRSRQVGDLRVAVEYRDAVSVIVHENMVAEHDQGNAKFLENAFNSERGEVTRIVAAEVRSKMGR